MKNRSPFIATFRFRNTDTGRSVCAAVLTTDPDTIRYGFDLFSRDQIILNENEFFASILPHLTHTAPFAVKSKSYLVNRVPQLLKEAEYPHH